MTNKIINPRFLFVASAILVAAVSRLLPHPYNFTPVAAMALFGAVYLENKLLAFIVPLATMLLSDVALELTTGWGFHNTIGYVYISVLLTSCIGLLVKRNPNLAVIAIGSVSASVLFFIITNFGVWAAGGFAGGISGLNATYMLGLPFFGRTLSGDLFYNALLFGSFYLAQRRYPALIRVRP